MSRSVDEWDVTLSAEMFRQIVDALKSDAQVQRDKRTGPRVGVRSQVVVMPLPGTRAAPQRVRCRNLSADGIGLLHTTQVRAGTRFVVRFEGTRLEQPIHILCVVVHCNQSGPDLYAIGARFVGVLSAEESARLAPTAA